MTCQYTCHQSPQRTNPTPILGKKVYQYRWVVGTISWLVLVFSSSCNFPVSAPENSISPSQNPTNTLEIPTGRRPTPTPFLPAEPTAITPSPVPPTITPPLSNEETINFLLAGSDRRAVSFRTDTLVVVSIRPRDQSVSMISIPRDLYVYIPGWQMQRINTAYQRGELVAYPGGGAQLLKDTVRHNLGIHIDHVAMVDFNGFRAIIDTLGGIDVPLVCPFTDWHIINPNISDQYRSNWALYTIGPDVVHMDGNLALWYARSRMRSSDFDRGRRQQEVLRAIFNQAINLNVIPKLPNLYNQLSHALITDLSLADLLALAPLASDLSPPHIRSYYINKSYVTGWRTPAGAAVQLPDHAAIQQLIAEAMAPPDEHETINWSTTVEVWNGTHTPNLDVLAAERLHYTGFETILSPADHQEYTQTILYDFTTGLDPHQNARLLFSLGLPSASLISNPNPESPGAYRLILGTDYNPCFDPAQLIH